jgi:CheY-like chemotaxis protein
MTVAPCRAADLDLGSVSMSPMKILLVDDSKSARYALRLQLQRHGAVVETADSAEAALERIKEAPPDAVFMDHTMPGMNGFEALDILKGSAATSRIPVIMCTSNEDPEFIAQAHRKGALDVLAKSTAPDKLPRLIEQLQDIAAAPPGAQPVPATAAQSVPGLAEAVSAIVRQEAERLIDERLDTSLEQRLRTLLAPLLAEHAERLKVELSAQAEATLGKRFEAETKRLQKHFIAVQSEQAHLSTQRLVNDVLPQAVIKQLEKERHSLARLFQELIDNSLDGLSEDPAFLRHVVDATEANAARVCEETLKRHSADLGATVSSEDAGLMANGMLQAVRDQTRTMYLLAAGSALVGIVAASVVYLLLT